MRNFRVDNGKEGVERIYHTTTGYECVANHSGNIADLDRIIFFVRYIVGGDGCPYTEIGLRGLNETERNINVHSIKEKLSKCRFTELMNKSKVCSAELSFIEYSRVPSDTIAFRVNCGGDGMLSVVSALSDYIRNSSLNFIEEQELIEDSLFQSILHNMGDELEKGSRGKAFAALKARQLAHQFKYGLDMKGNSSLQRFN